MRAPRVAALAVLGLACSIAAAQDHILVKTLPANLDQLQVLDLTRVSLKARGWKVLPSDATSVAAEKGAARIRIAVVGGALRYDPEGTTIPPREITALNSDLTAAFAPATPPPPTRGKLLVGYLPPGTPLADVMQAARYALAGRRWSIQANSDDVIRARLVRSGADARITVFYANGALQYVEESEIPPHWIDNLRADVSRLLMRQRAASERIERAEAAKARASNSPSVNAERLRALKQLYDSGTITRDEYDKKRAEILKDL